MPLPQHVQITLTILQRSVHFIASTQRAAALGAMRVLHRGLPALQGAGGPAGGPAGGALLPLAHRAWGPLAARFRSSDPVLLRAALQLLLTLAALAKDFLTTRTLKLVRVHSTSLRIHT